MTSALVLLFLPACALFFVTEPQTGQPESVYEIMARVAQNQDRAQEMRSAFVYDQTLLVRFKRGNGKIAREELKQYLVIPTPTGTKKSLTSFQGRYEKKGKLIEYREPGFKYKEIDIDGGLIDELADGLTNEERSRDGITMNLFPLTTKQQRKYVFTLKGREDYRDSEVYRIEFKPRKHGWGLDDDGDDEEDQGVPWAGEILVDIQEHQPVLVSSRLAKGIPVLVKTLLGTNIKGLGFKLAFARFDEGLWFPVNYGAEFDLRAAFFYKRKIAIALNNSGFQRAEVATRITFDQPLTIDKVLKIPEVKRPVPRNN